MIDNLLSQMDFPLQHKRCVGARFPREIATSIFKVYREA